MTPQEAEAPHVPIESPWGMTTDRIELMDGIYGYWVEGHGPVERLSEEMNAKVPPELRSEGGWYETTHPVPRMVAAQPGQFTERKRAIRQLRQDYASAWIDVRDRTKRGRPRDLGREGPGPRHRAAIRRLNDDLRRRDRGGRKMITATLNAYGRDTVFLIAQRVKHFSSFTPDNDPYGERDCASFVLDAFGFPAVKVVWKIDYYASLIGDGYSYGSEAPWDPRQTNRVLTIMDASDA